MNNTPNPKCSGCKCFWKPDETDIKPSGLFFKTCKKCRTKRKAKCEHDRQKSQCRECGGSQICEHERQKSTCRECGGSQICEHGRQKTTCRECGGSQICEHDKRKSQCRECGGSQICEHERQKSTCRECGGSEICEHDKIRSQCRECGGSEICEHDKRKSRCRECGGSQICQHDKIRSQCRECGGSQICQHDKIKSRCRECGGSSFCEHDKIKSTCRECNFKLYLVNLQRVSIKRCLKQSKLHKSKHSIEYLGCTVEEFIEHFKKKMDNFNLYSEVEMIWENIHIDHIKPVSSFNLDDEDEFLSCCNYTNLQPLIGVDNLNKSCKWSDDNEKYWVENIKDNEKYCDIYMP